MNTKNLSVTGTSDNPTEEDYFGIEAYTKGLADFISNCTCPMTVAIQGDWGTGKTSMIKRIENKYLDSKCIAIDFNTWEYSQFDLDNSLPIVFYTSLIVKMGGKKESPNLANKVRQAIKDILLFCLSEAENSNLGRLPSLLFGGAKAGLENVDVSKVGDNLVETIKKLRTNFEEVLESRLKSEKGKDRMIIFIDDLDRIEPQRAVELLEVLKTILEVDHCVFVLAIDYDVVVRGIKAKYGSDIDEKKARSFFDKIIQVPFSLPVGSYNIGKYVTELLKKACNTVSEDGLLKKTENVNSNSEELVVREETVALIKHSVGCNPRAIKRLINSLSLLSLIWQAQSDNDHGTLKPDEEVTLFASLCLQLAYGRIYEYLLSIRTDKKKVEDLFNFLETLDPQMLESGQVFDQGTDSRIKDILKLKAYSKEEIYQISEFFGQFRDILFSDEKNTDNTEEGGSYCIDNEKFKLLNNTLVFTSSTSVDQESVDMSDRLPLKVIYVYRVVEEVLKNKIGLRDATRNVANTASISNSTVIDKYTRRLGGINTKDFEELLNQYKKGDDKLLEKLKKNNQDRYESIIDEEFSKLNTYRENVSQ